MTRRATPRVDATEMLRAYRARMETHLHRLGHRAGWGENEIFRYRDSNNRKDNDDD